MIQKTAHRPCAHPHAGGRESGRHGGNDQPLLPRGHECGFAKCKRREVDDFRVAENPPGEFA